MISSMVAVFVPKSLKLDDIVAVPPLAIKLTLERLLEMGTSNMWIELAGI